jgi:protein SCO1/2
MISRRVFRSACLVSLVILLNGSCSTEPDTLPFFNTGDFAPEWISVKDPSYGSIHSISAFAFVDQNGDTITEQSIMGKIVVADFFFTVCPGICPRLTKNMGLIQETFRADSSITLLSHSVTPGLDSIPRLKEYALIHNVDDKKWHLLTGNRQEIYRVARESYFADEKTGIEKGRNDFIHTENFILLDGRQRIRGVYNGTNPSEIQRLTEDILILKKESGNEIF